MTFTQQRGAGERAAPPGPSRRWGAMAMTLLCGLALILSALVPYDTWNQGGGAYQAIAQMPGDQPVHSVQDVITTYRLEQNVGAYLEVNDEQQIYFHGRSPAGSSKK